MKFKPHLRYLAITSLSLVLAYTPTTLLAQQGWPPIIVAARDGDVGAVRRLLAEGADVNVRNPETLHTGLMVAASYGELEMVKFLPSAGADPTLRDVEGRTALVRAEANRNSSVAQVLRGAMNTLPAANRPSQKRNTGPAVDYEREFARYDITKGGWLSGTELDACGCRHYDFDRDGEVTRKEFLAGRTMEKAEVKPTAAPVARATGAPARPQPQPRVQPAPVRAPAPARKPAPAPVAAGGLPVGKYNCTYYSMGTIVVAGSVTIMPGGRYQYLNGGTGNYAFDRATSSLRWLSGPFVGSDVQGEFRYRDDGRPLIQLKGGNFASHTNRCVGPAQ